MIIEAKRIEHTRFKRRTCHCKSSNSKVNEENSSSRNRNRIIWSFTWWFLLFSSIFTVFQRINQKCSSLVSYYFTGANRVFYFGCFAADFFRHSNLSYSNDVTKWEKFYNKKTKHATASPNNSNSIWCSIQTGSKWTFSCSKFVVVVFGSAVAFNER